MVDSEKVTAWMQEMEPGFNVSHVVDDMIDDTLGSPLYNPDSQVSLSTWCVRMSEQASCGHIFEYMLQKRTWDGEGSYMYITQSLVL